MNARQAERAAKAKAALPAPDTLPASPVTSTVGTSPVPEFIYDQNGQRFRCIPDPVPVEPRNDLSSASSAAADTSASSSASASSSGAPGPMLGDVNRSVAEEHTCNPNLDAMD